MPIRLDRRAFVTAAAASVLPAGGAAAAGKSDKSGSRIPFGAAVNHEVLPADAAYRANLARHCDLVVAEGAMKWAAMRPSRDAFDTAAADRLVAFARSHELGVRGHCLAWNEANPDWLHTIASRNEAERLLRDHIARTVRHFAGIIHSWDVVNEPIADKPRNSVDLRPGIWTSRLGERYIDLAFRAAADVAPDGERVLNEYAIEHATPRDRLKRAAFKRLVFDLLDRGVPITAVGLQGHLDGALDIDEDAVAAFCADMHRAGLGVLVTELDVNDVALPTDATARDRIVADRTRAFLGAVRAGCQPTAICTWGISDRYTWMPMWFKRADGTPNRPLPLDRDYAAKPMMAVLSSLLGG